MSPENPYPPGPTPPAPDTPPEGDGVAPAEPEAQAKDAPKPPPTCKVCGCELDADQTYCLECGTPTPLAPKMRRGAGGLAAVALGLVVLGAGAGALAYVASGDDGTAAPAPMVSTAPVITVPTDAIPTTTTDSSLPSDTTSTLPTDTTGLFPDTTSIDTTGVDTSGGLPVDTTATTGDAGGLMTVTGPGVDGQTTSELPSSGGINDGTSGISTDSSGGSSTPSNGEWPAGTSGWTAIVSSVTNESSARAAASKLQSQGEPGGVLFSSDHPPLRPGYWVVFSGVYTTKSEALSHARSLLPKWPGAYPRRIDN